MCEELVVLAADPSQATLIDGELDGSVVGKVDEGGCFGVLVESCWAGGVVADAPCEAVFGDGGPV